MKRRPWKEYFFESGSLEIESAWSSSWGAFGKDKVVRVMSGGLVATNLSDRDFRLLCRHAGVRHVPDYVSDTRPPWEQNEDAETDEEWEDRMAEVRREHAERMAR